VVQNLLTVVNNGEAPSDKADVESLPLAGRERRVYCRRDAPIERAATAVLRRLSKAVENLDLVLVAQVHPGVPGGARYDFEFDLQIECGELCVGLNVRAGRRVELIAVGNRPPVRTIGFAQMPAGKIPPVKERRPLLVRLGERVLQGPMRNIERIQAF